MPSYKYIEEYEMCSSLKIQHAPRRLRLPTQAEGRWERFLQRQTSGACSMMVRPPPFISVHIVDRRQGMSKSPLIN